MGFRINFTRQKSMDSAVKLRSSSHTMTLFSRGIIPRAEQLSVDLNKFVFKTYRLVLPESELLSWQTDVLPTEPAIPVVILNSLQGKFSQNVFSVTKISVTLTSTEIRGFQTTFYIYSCFTCLEKFQLRIVVPESVQSCAAIHLLWITWNETRKDIQVKSDTCLQRKANIFTCLDLYLFCLEYGLLFYSIFLISFLRFPFSFSFYQFFFPV
jgi:hypothetical protein